MILISDKGKVLAKSQYEIFYIMNDSILNDFLIYIIPVPDIQFFYIYVIEQVLIFERSYGFQCMLSCSKGSYKIVRQISLMVVFIGIKTAS